MKSASTIFLSRTEAIMCLLQIATLRGCEERMGGTKGYKGSTMMQAWLMKRHISGWKKVTLISEEIKSLALAILELCLSEGISK